MPIDPSVMIQALLQTVVVLGVGWLLKRVLRATKADLDMAINKAVDESRKDITDHNDKRFDELAMRLDRQDRRWEDMSTDVSWLFGRLGENPPSAIAQRQGGI